MAILYAEARSTSSNPKAERLASTPFPPWAPPEGRAVHARIADIRSDAGLNF